VRLRLKRLLLQCRNSRIHVARPVALPVVYVDLLRPLYTDEIKVRRLHGNVNLAVRGYRTAFESKWSAIRLWPCSLINSSVLVLQRSRLSPPYYRVA
jgi:hypothetical protein